MPPPPATPAPRAASCFAKEAVRQGRPEPPPPPLQPHPSLRLRQTKGGGLRSHQPSRTQEFLIGGKGPQATAAVHKWRGGEADWDNRQLSPAPRARRGGAR